MDIVPIYLDDFEKVLLSEDEIKVEKILQKGDQQYKDELKKHRKIIKKKEHLASLSNKSEIIDDNNQENDIKTPEYTNVVSEDQIINIDFYYKDVMDAINEEELEIVLPRDTYNFNNIINLILLKLYKEINDINEIMNQSNDNNQEKEEYEVYLENIEDKIQMLFDYRDNIQEESICDNQSKKIHLIFMPANNSDYQFEKDIDKYIPKESYNYVKNVLDRFQSGHFSNYKYLFGMGFHETRKNQIRVFYEYYENNNAIYVFIIACTIKKTSRSFEYYDEYYNMLRSKYLDFYNDTIVKLNDPKNAAAIILENEEVLGRVLQKIEEGYKYEKSIN